MSKKSYWMGVSTRGPRSQEAILSWLGPLCYGYTVESASILCDTATDREKKLKAVVVDTKGRRRIVTRTLGGRRWTLVLSAPLPEAGDA